MAAESTDVVADGGADAAGKAWEWEERVVSAVPAASADEAWALLSDFLAFHRWHPRVAACRLASGTPRAPGCVRYCEGTPDGDGVPPDWAHETLLEYDPDRRFFRYEMNDNNMGFGLFFATFRVVPAAAGAGCELRWEFECEPVRGTPREALVARLQAGLDGMAARVRDHVLAARAGSVVAGGLGAADELKLDNSIAV
ncbi:lachrymatory-factor synthase-like [Phragmites australis]|uniref:lachrymatory-factor synthase-like n=1 Tax=Phragmites australis TaxID=29695 RepID=UPI002D7A1FB8|nr:lachrymatory-factor synthase-like [Phragmites australis]